jgi:hypothetical protein
MSDAATPAPPAPRGRGRPRKAEAGADAAAESPRERKSRAEHGQRTIPVVLQRLQARGVDLSEWQLRRAVKLGEVRTVPFAGLPRIPQEEEDRLVALLGPDTPAETPT